MKEAIITILKLLFFVAVIVIGIVWGEYIILGGIVIFVALLIYLYVRDH